MVGQLLGAAKFEEAKDSARKLLFFSVMSCLVLGLLMILVAPFFPEIYQTEPEVKKSGESIHQSRRTVYAYVRL